MRHQVTEAEAGSTLEEVLTGPLRISRRMIQRLTRSRGITLNGRAGFLGRRLRQGDAIAVRVVDVEEPTLPPVPMELAIMYEDADVVVVDKPPGLLVHPTSPQHTRTLAHGIAHHFARQGLETKVRPVHRIDRDTSGAIILARSAFAHQLLDRQLRDGRLAREYVALVEGRVEGEGSEGKEGSIDAPIGRARHSPTLRAVVPGGQPALTTFAIEERFADATLLRVRLQTGRTHQIRVHLSHIGHPLVGDREYGARSRMVRFPRYALHSARVSFAQPRTDQQITLDVPLPADLQALIDELRQRGVPGTTG